MIRLTADRFARLKALQRPSAPSIARERIRVGVESFGRTSDLATGSEQLALILGASVKRNSHGEHLSLRCWHGDPAPCAPTTAALRLLAPGAPDDVVDAQRWLFLDTETTGLAGGTGTYPFLVGLAWWEGGGLEVEQLFMREYSEEGSLLAALADRMAERPLLITFNGKSFDWPLLETRYRLTRALTVPKPLAHLDLLHPARSLWRLRLGSVRLSQLERHVLGRDRGADLPSELIPKIYLDFIRSGQAEPLVPVFHHNQMDLCGLAGLSGRILSLLGDEMPNCNDGLELFGLSRIYERRGERKRARKLYEQSIATALPTEADRAARHALARLAKRDGDLLRAREIWESTVGDSREGYEAYEQLAIYFEHERHQPLQALAIVQEALAELHRAKQTGTIASPAYRRAKTRFERRLDRLKSRGEWTLLDKLLPG